MSMMIYHTKISTNVKKNVMNGSDIIVSMLYIKRDILTSSTY